jgi:AAA domain
MDAQPERPAIVKIDSRQPQRAISLGQLLDKTFPPGNFMIGAGFMSRGSIIVIGGPPKAYKSFLVNTILYHLATATPLFGATRQDKKGRSIPVFPIKDSHRCLLLEQEVGEEDLQHRLIEDTTPEVVAFDPLIEFHQQDENSATAMAKVMHGLSELRAQWGFSSLINHHLSKPQQNMVREGPDQLRGSSVIYGKGDTFVTLKPNNVHGQIRLQFKLRRAAPIEDMYIQLNKNTLRFEFAFWATSPKGARAQEEEHPSEQLPGQGA